MKRRAIFLMLCLPLLVKAQTVDPKAYFSALQWQKAHTAAAVDYLTIEEQHIFLFNNLARMYPQDFLKLYHDYTSSGEWPWGGRNSSHYHHSLTQQLENMEPVGALYPDEEMYELAACWAEESGKLGVVGHDRVDCPGGFRGENCAYGNEKGLDIVLQLLIDTNVPSLGHRKNMLRAGYKGMGVAIRGHGKYGVCAVQDFTYTNDSLRMVEHKEDAIRQVRLVAQQKAREAEAARLEALSAARVARGQALHAGFEAEWTQIRAALEGVDYLTEYELVLYQYINLIRLNPQQFQQTIWKEGPFFDQPLEEVRTQVQSVEGYQRLDAWMRQAEAQQLLVPTREQIAAGRCVQRLNEPDQRAFACMEKGGFISMDSFFYARQTADAYRLAMRELLSEKFNVEMVLGKGIVVMDIHENGYLNRVFLKN